MLRNCGYSPGFLRRSVRPHYLLGLAYEGADRKKEAVVQYEKFLAIWKDADPRLEELGMARERLRALRENGRSH